MIEFTPEIFPARDVFTELESTEASLRQLEVKRMHLIARACDEWQVDEEAAIAGAERLTPGGADGTTSVGEFLCGELAGILRCSVPQMARKISDVLNLRDRHPLLWRAVGDLKVAPWQARELTEECARAGLSFEAARWVDKQVDIALGVMSFRRVLKSLPSLIVQADPALAAERAERERRARSARVVDMRDGGAAFFARMDAADAVALDETLADLANVLAAHGDTRGTQERRAAALGLLAEPERAAALLAGEQPGASKRTVKLFVHLPAGTVVDGSAGIADVEGVGTLTRDDLVRFLGTSRVTVQPVVDHNQIPAVDSYAVPPLMRESVVQRNPVEVFPWSHRSSRTCQMDHTVPYDHHAPPGSNQTRPGNLGPLAARAHRIKTHGGWQVDQLEEGTFLWTSLKGFRYLVTPRGTHPLGRQGITVPWTPNVDAASIDFVWPAA